MSWFWIALLVFSTLSIGAYLGLLIHAWGVTLKGYRLIDSKCVECCKDVPQIIYSNTQSGGFVFCSDKCVETAHEKYRDQQALVVELTVARQVERETTNQVVILQAAVISSYVETEASLNLQISERDTTIRRMEEMLSSITSGISA